MKTEEDILELIREDHWMMNLLKAVQSLQLPDWWICAGFVRSKIWDTLHTYQERTPLPDIDVIYYNPSNIDESEEKELERKLNQLVAGIPWSVKNQARMHVLNDMPPYTSSTDGISKFPETVTALGVKLDEKDNLVLTAPWGIEDVLNLKVRPTPYYLEGEERVAIYNNRMSKKKWNSIWEKVEVCAIEYK
ncbi:MULTISPECIES: nucleotidyltransferase family protein [Bacillaceae]|uniref:Nucleotidyltransferase family protein n=1 Tax=Bacillus mesophilum TaxID=1071718 RepID=A0A7V7RNN2_9BACI|nr:MULTISPECIES: nucleotidyltransferase family protein [Bacillaceae]KAB2334128.1 nucleotidyltransferase family protein [Bacillus mesophilum]